MLNGRKCRECGYPIEGRRDKKFCTDYCRSIFNNRIYRNDNNYIRKVNSILRKNRKLLQHFSKKELIVLRKEKLDQIGFDFDHFTHIEKSNRGHMIKYCYDIGYCLTYSGEVIIVDMKEIESEKQGVS